MKYAAAGTVQDLMDIVFLEDIANIFVKSSLSSSRFCRVPAKHLKPKNKGYIQHFLQQEVVDSADPWIIKTIPNSADCRELYLLGLPHNLTLPIRWNVPRAPTG